MFGMVANGTLPGHNNINSPLNTAGRDGFKFDIFKCHLVDLNNPRILITHDKMAVAANIWA